MKSAYLVFWTLLLSGAVFAQSDRGTITGTVTDQGGSTVPNATVTAVNGENGTRVTSATTNTGNYTIPSLQAGPYSLEVEAPGFKKTTQTGIQIAVAAIVSVDVILFVF